MHNEFSGLSAQMYRFAFFLKLQSDLENAFKLKVFQRNLFELCISLTYKQVAATTVHQIFETKVQQLKNKYLYILYIWIGSTDHINKLVLMLDTTL